MVHKEILATPSIPAGKGVWTFYGEATIEAPAEKVYETLRDFKSYPRWNQYTPKISTPNESNDVQVGDMITLAYRPESTGNTMDVPCKMMSISDSELSICWRGCAFSLPTFVLLPEKVQTVTRMDGKRCVFRIWETQAGPLAHVVKWQMGKKLSDMNQGIADNLKAYVEGGMSGGT